VEEKQIRFTFGNGANVGDPFCLLIESQAANIMVDCGLGHGSDEDGNGKSVSPPLLAKLNGTPVHGVLATHGHLDHVGDLPHLAEKNCGNVYMSKPTRDFAKMHWFDSMRIAIRKWCADQGISVKQFFEQIIGQSVQAKNYWKEIYLIAEEVGVKLPFSNSDIDLVGMKTKIARAGEEFMVKKAIIKPVNAGHILGALGYKVNIMGRRIFVSGDFSMKETSYGLFPPLDPQAIGPVDVLVVNATYAGARLESLASEKIRFLADVEEATDRGRSVLIPVFSIDRATKVYSVLREKGLEKYVRIAGQAQSGFRIYHNYTQAFWGVDRCCFCDPREEKDLLVSRLTDHEPAIYLVTSGMMMEETISHTFAKRLIPSDDALIAAVGYMAPDTPGRKLLDAAEAGEKRIQWNGSGIPLRAGVKSYQFSAHARSREIAELIKALEPKYVVFPHSETDRVNKFIQEYSGLPGEKIIPENGKPIIFK